MTPEIKESGFVLSFKDIFTDYPTFMNQTRDPIYRAILLAFDALKEKEKVAVNISATVDDTEFESELEFTKANLDILTDVINPYFEKIEDYETCVEVMKVLSDLQKN